MTEEAIHPALTAEELATGRYKDVPLDFENPVHREALRLMLDSSRLDGGVLAQWAAETPEELHQAMRAAIEVGVAEGRDFRPYMIVMPDDRLVLALTGNGETSELRARLYSLTPVVIRGFLEILELLDQDGALGWLLTARADAAEQIGLLADRADNLAGASQLAVRAEIHIEGMRSGLESIARDLKALVVALTGENPWATTEEDPS